MAIDLSKLPALPPPTPIAHCPGWGDGPDDWLEECQYCQRRTAAAGPETLPPPQIVVFFCENYIPPDPPENQRLRELARELF